MKRIGRDLFLISLAGLVALLSTAGVAGAQTTAPFLKVPTGTDLDKVPHPAGVQRCTGPIRLVTDVGFENVRTTAVNWGVPPAGAGGEGARFDPVPVLSTTVSLLNNTCLNAHLSALVGSRQTYAFAASITMFQVTLTPIAGGAPQHMYGHYETPYGIYAPAVAIEAERDVDEFSANFFTRVTTAPQPGDVIPGIYRVDVWWAGGPVGGGGAIGAAFVLKLYLS
jgi:hypothetical protein